MLERSMFAISARTVTIMLATGFASPVENICKEQPPQHNEMLKWL